MRKTTHLLQHINVDHIDDARLENGFIVFSLRDGRRLRIKMCRESLELYWKVKIRNRRRAFGL